MRELEVQCHEERIRERSTMPIVWYKSSSTAHNPYARTEEHNAGGDGAARLAGALEAREVALAGVLCEGWCVTD
jgi:hypothetical protein